MSVDHIQSKPTWACSYNPFLQLLLLHSRLKLLHSYGLPQTASPFYPPSIIPFSFLLHSLFRWHNNNNTPSRWPHLRHRQLSVVAVTAPFHRSPVDVSGSRTTLFNIHLTPSPSNSRLHFPTSSHINSACLAFQLKGPTSPASISEQPDINTEKTSNTSEKMKVSTHITSGVLLVGGCAKLAMAGMGIDGGFDADMLIHFPGFFRAPRAATGNTFVSCSSLSNLFPSPSTSS
jgi:hypothetical protein